MSKDSRDRPPGEIEPLRKARPTIPEDDVQRLLEDFAAILRSGQLTQGEYLSRFEKAFAAYVGVRHAVAMSSGTAPLEVAMRSFGVSDREVIVPTNTFIATANAVLLAGGVPVFCDIAARSLWSGLEQIEPLVTSRTRGIIAVHIAGQICPDIDAIRRFCELRGLFVLEDAAHAHGARIDARMAGSMGDAAAFSLYPTKVITSGEGGMLTTDDDELASFARGFRSHGQDDGRGELVQLGANFRLPELSAALGLRQLTRLEEFLGERNRVARAYEDELAPISNVDLFSPPPPRHRHAYYKLPALLPPQCDRGVVASTLSSRFGVAVGSCYWPPCHLQPFYRRLKGGGPGNFPVAEDVLPRTITLPIYPGLTGEQVARVVEGLAAAVDHML